MIMNPTAIKHVVVDGHSLTLESFVAIARYNATVELAPSALEAMKKSRALAEKIAAEGRVAYGITTGFGEFQKVAVPKEMSNQLSTNLILSHCTAAGEPYADEIVRGMMLLRANALCGGVSGVRPILVEMLLEMLNKGVTPVVPQKGSLGSSGDLAPLAHMTLPMLGKGEAMYEGVKMPGAEAMAKAGIKTLDTLVSKEGLGMTNGTCAMTSVGALALYDTICAAQLGDVIASMSFEGLTGLRNAFDPRIHQVRGQKGQMLVAANMRKLLDGSEILDNCQKDRVQDAYALRCIPQLHGACRDALDYVREKVEIELNAVTDNPLMFLDDEAVISGGNSGGPLMNLYGEVVGIVSAKYSSYSDTTVEGLGFANPIGDVQAIITDIIENGQVTGKAYLAIKAGTMTEQMATQYNIGISEGVFVYSVVKGGAGDKAGLRLGDVITKMGDTTLTSRQDLSAAMKGYRAGDTVTLTVYRGGQYIEVELTFDTQPQTTGSDDSSQSSDNSYGYGNGGNSYGGGNRGGYQQGTRPAPSSAIGDGFMNIPDGVEDEGLPFN